MTTTVEWSDLMAVLVDADLRQRLIAFAREDARTSADCLAAFQFRAGVPYAPGCCFSCGDPLPALTFGRCWRCACAWRIACGVTVHPDVAAARDTARIIA